jgi:spore germination cell wall hydrolase CwlJ-like protein
MVGQSIKAPLKPDWGRLLPVGILASALVVLAAGYGLQFAGYGVAGAAISSPQNRLVMELPAIEPLMFKPTPPDEALAINASIPVSGLPNPAASPYGFASKDLQEYTKSLHCLTAAVYYEAAIESTDGQRAVAQVVINRVRHAAYPKSICGVVFQGSERKTGCQFTFTCDGSLRRKPSQRGWQRAQAVAQAALGGSVYKAVGWATHYHTNWVVPYWSASLTKVANVGTHIFYRWTGSWGGPSAFRNAVSGVEPTVAHLDQPSAEVAEEAEIAPETKPAPQVEVPERQIATLIAAAASAQANIAPLEIASSPSSIGLGSASMSAAARVRAVVGVRAEPNANRAGCRQTSVAAIGASSGGPPPC